MTCVQVPYVASDGESQAQGVGSETHAELVVLLRAAELETTKRCLQCEIAEIKWNENNPKNVEHHTVWDVRDPVPTIM